MWPTPPELPMDANIWLDHKGAPMRVRGRLMDTDGNPIAGARIDVWQANDDGIHGVQQKGIQPDFILLGALGRHPYRPAHLHYIVQAAGFDRLVIHIFAPADAVFGVKESPMIHIQPMTDRSAGFDGPFPDLSVDVVLSRSGT